MRLLAFEYLDLTTKQKGEKKAVKMKHSKTLCGESKKIFSCFVNQRSSLLYILLMALYLLNRPVSASGSNSIESSETTKVLVNGNIDANRVHENYQVFKFHFEAISDPLTITLWILLGSLVKIGMNNMLL